MAIANLIAVDRAIHELRSGRSVNIDGTDIFHPEFIAQKTFENLNNPSLIITANRAHALTSEKYSGNQKISLKNQTIADIHQLISGKTPKTTITPTDNEAALELARIAKLLPAAIISETTNGMKISASDIINYRSDNAESLKEVAAAPLKLHDARIASIKAFRTANGAEEHLAIIIGKPTDEPLIRIHSSCYTGDLLGSLACDCGDQLRGAIKLIDEQDGGIIIYLMQEGRGIGLINKLRAYQLQAGGLDTVEANEFLGFDDEERSFGAAAAILKQLNIKTVKLVTNNPKKTKGLTDLGINVTAIIPLIITHEHNQAYLDTKSTKSGHIL